jgi:hypothetical protein
MYGTIPSKYTESPDQKEIVTPTGNISRPSEKALGTLYMKEI